MDIKRIEQRTAGIYNEAVRKERIKTPKRQKGAWDNMAGLQKQAHRDLIDYHEIYGFYSDPIDPIGAVFRLDLADEDESDHGQRLGELVRLYADDYGHYTTYKQGDCETKGLFEDEINKRSMMKSPGRKFRQQAFALAEDDIADFSTQIHDISQLEDMVNFRLYGQGVLATFDPRNHKLMEPKPGDMCLRGDKDHLLEQPKDIRNNQQTASQVAKRSKRDGREVGISHAKQLINSALNGRLTSLYSGTRLGSAILAWLPSGKANVWSDVFPNPPSNHSRP
ncbi:hypothetical protein EDB81DRAFT_850754 [Dactylonectria macrodidyma]|uniref:Uncharacterized protein n=1 Tax=Dactylonectria macrodidyma TaxID=307937 RepID=A0A9P9FUX4_9HYPO|nr:hypothetical protein EDB81DRAFT_850754 [Dactylonectria macrodidyma]